MAVVDRPGQVPPVMVPAPVKPSIVFTVHDRPAYLRRTLESWERVRGISAARLVFRCEPGCPGAVALCRSVGFAEATVTVNPRRYGVLTSPWHAFEDGFTAGRFTILAEEDLIVSTDVLEYFTWCDQRYRDDPGVLGVTTHQHDAQPGGLAGIAPACWTGDDPPHLWVWATWRDRWRRLLRADWDHTYAHRGWDWRIRDHWVLGQGMRVMAPSMARSQHIGEHGGAHCMPGQFGALESRCFAGDVPPQDYREVPAL